MMNAEIFFVHLSNFKRRKVYISPFPVGCKVAHIQAHFQLTLSPPPNLGASATYETVGYLTLLLMVIIIINIPNHFNYRYIKIALQYLVRS